LSRFVLDASVALAWFVDSPASAYATRVKQALLHGAHAVVPALWHLEMANGFAVAQRRGILAAADASQSVSHLEQLLAHAIESSADFVSLREALTHV
jgi:predicted nucleic acid-binding protein